MYKIRRVKFEGHPILGNLDLNFCDSKGRAVDTVIIAGENGVGKSTILNMLYKIATHTVDIQLYIEIEDDDSSFELEYRINGYLNDKPVIYANNGRFGLPVHSSDMRERYPFSGIFSDVGINFKAKPIQSITSQDLDTSGLSRRSPADLAYEINQLFVDIQNIDDSIFAQVNRPLVKDGQLGKDTTEQERMPRFINAFNKMFDDLKYDCIENKNNTKMIMFTKNGARFPIEDLSSGEKQIIYRGAFLLRDANATNGAFVFIDEPEISLHPLWQQKVMNFYKDIFTNDSGQQTSQIFAVTHSPFIIHNNSRYNDKVIVLTHDVDGNIAVMDKPEYFKCNSPEVVQDAFSISNFDNGQPTVYVEGETDEKYFNKALEVYSKENLPFRFKWVGYYEENDRSKSNPKNTGKEGLDRTSTALRSIGCNIKNVFLYDSDAKKSYEHINNIIICSLPYYDNANNITKGIENLLIYDNIDLNKFIKKDEKKNGDGSTNIIAHLCKDNLCEYICNLDDEQLKDIFLNLSKVIDHLEYIFNGEDCSDYFWKQ